MIIFSAVFLTVFLSCGFSRRIHYEDDIDRHSDVLSYLKKWVNDKTRETFLPQNGELFEGDIVMASNLRRAIQSRDSKRSALADTKYKWPNRIVPYEFDSSLVPEVHDGILEAIGQFEKYTCIKFIPRKEEHDYVIFKSEPHKCSSNVGRSGGHQYITLGSGCSRIGTILHEMMHSLGIVHEQSRPDRDDHVIVEKENIEEKYIHNFQKYSFEDVTNMDVPYNYASLMHYRNNAFTKNGKPTLVSRNNPSLHFGQRLMFSLGDIDQINRLYSCSKSKRYQRYDQGNRFKDDVNKLSLIPNVFDTPDEYL